MVVAACLGFHNMLTPNPSVSFGGKPIITRRLGVGILLQHQDNEVNTRMPHTAADIFVYIYLNEGFFFRWECTDGAISSLEPRRGNVG